MADTLGDLTSALQNYVVAPLNAFGLGGYVFDAQGEGIATLGADITDHYTEDNKAIQDHIALKPKRITLKGYVGEVVSNGPGGGQGILQQVTQKLTVISAFLPQLSAAAVQGQAALAGINDSGASAQSLTSALPAAANIYGLVQNIIGQVSGETPRQQSAYQYFAACQSGGILMGIQTPWEFLTNMAVETIVAIQGEDSIFMTDFAVTFKQIRIAQTTTVTALSGTGGVVPGGQTFSQAVTALQGAPQVNNGINSGTPSIISLSNAANNPLAGVFQY